MADGGNPQGGFSQPASPDVASMMQQLTAAKSGGGTQLGRGGKPGVGSPNTQSNQSGKPARRVSDLPTEAGYLASDVARGLGSLLPESIQKMLNLKPTDSPQEIAKKKQILTKFNQLSDEDRQVAVQRYQAQIKKEQQEKQLAEQKKQQEAQKKQDLPQPQGKRQGMMAGMPGQKPKSKSDAFMQQFNQQRKTLSSAG